MTSNSATIPETRSTTSASRGGASIPFTTPSPDRDRVEDVEERGLALTEQRTPNRRKTGSRTTKDLMERVRDKAPYGERCSISLDKGPCLEGCHVVCRWTGSDVLDCLEYAWGYNHRQFNVDSSDNLLLMRADWHHMYDARHHWMLVPTPNMVQKIYTHCMKFKDTLGSSEKGKRPPIDLAYPKAASYEYYVLAASSMSEVIIDRHTLTPDGGDPAIPPRISHRFPFDTLGPIESHILPHYAIFNCGSKIFRSSPRTILDMDRRYQLITGNAAEARIAWRQIIDLYMLWTRLAVPSAFKETKDLRQEQGDEYKPPRAQHALKKRRASRMGSNYGPNKRHTRHIVLPPPHDSDSECSIDSDTPLTEAEVMEMNDSLKLVSSWRTTSSKEFLQGHPREKTVASRKDIGKYTGEPPRKASTVDLNPEGPPVDYYPSHLVAAALKKIDGMNR